MTRRGVPSLVRLVRDAVTWVAAARRGTLMPALTPALAVALGLAVTDCHAAGSDAAAADPVLLWNDQTNIAIQVTSTDAFTASRALALESVAVLDTIRSIDGGPAFLVRLSGPRGVKPEVAAAAAAHEMLSLLFPARRAAMDAVFDASVSRAPAGAARDRAVAFGNAVADAVFAVRDRDGWDGEGTNGAGNAPGQWQPTPPGFSPPLVPQWAKLTPFVLTSPAQFRPAGPPSLTTAMFRDAAAYVAMIGAVHSAVRTANQTEIAHYWSDAIGTYAPAGHWNAITATLLAPLGLGLDAEAELFARLNVAMADAGIAITDAKYTFWFWRPITVIRAGAAGAPANPDWSPLLETPNHPSYISGHSGFSGAASVILTDRFGVRPFSFASASVPGVTRGFTSFQQAAEEAAFSRVLGGIHYEFDNADGLATGRAVGAWTLLAFRRIAEDRGPRIVMDRPANVPTQGTQALTGFALDNRSPVTAVTVRPGGDARFSVAVDDRGRFTIPAQRVEPGGVRDVAIMASSAAGRTTTVRLMIDSGGQVGTVTVPVTVK